jgi:hypothetical protein
MTTFSGGCLCGRIRYTTEAAPAFTGICHCRSCQRATGSAFSTSIAFPKGSVTLSAEPASYRSTADSGAPITRGFCPVCGSSVTVEAAAVPGMLLIAAGTLDDTSTISPGAELFCASAQPWVKLDGERAQFQAMPPG